MTSSPPTWDHEVDILLAGSGAGGMAGAISAHDAGLSALVVEKAPRYGGSTALSGGGIWIPNNPTLERLGRADDPEDVRRYLRAIIGDRVPAVRLDAYVEQGPAAMAMLHRVSRHMDFAWCPGYSDYHPEEPGGRPLGRTIEPKPIDARRLGADEELLLEADLPSPMGLWFTGYEGRRLMMFRRTWSGKWMLRVAAWRVLSNLVRRRRMKTLGASLVVRLRLTMQDLRIPLWLNSPLIDLVVEDGRVTGAVVERDGRPLRVRARRGVVIATGGFDHDAELRKEHLPELGREDFSAGARSNAGDGIRIGRRIGADLDLMDDAWWMPSIKLPGGSIFPLVTERCIPRMVIVDQNGERFTNEAAPYVNFVHAQLEGGHVPAYEIFDATARKRYQFAGIMPGRPFPRDWYTTGLVTKAADLDELARRIGVPADALKATVERFNGFARNGRDEDFGRGDSAYDHYYGDPTLPNPNLDRIGAGPYYAVRIEAGDLGTKGGLVTDEHARVLGADGAPIEGLYATGNASASVMGNEYAGAGATIGPAITFGHLAARHAAARPALRG
ncbi:3-ketosteroid-delta-1-dehydrogenase [Actinomadura sp. CNU-125]|uniref:FAD-binding protein n=1 Tax=Actinomadura sp. CNU-125 TaxID=1904961 RepID=UPI0009606FCF|nr:FAD-binding protein [Actinomadura sp. CNU-125]OLT37739.1 3-ketosteroid-delta-1-dehydrogenase [Actinomadura sp. CNU-125]